MKIEIEVLISKNKQEEIQELYTHFCSVSQNTLVTIGTYIKENPSEFICLI